MTKSPPWCIRRTSDSSPPENGNSLNVIPAINTRASGPASSVRRCAESSCASGSPSRRESTAAEMPCIRAAPLCDSASVNRSASNSTSTARDSSTAVNASCSSCALDTHGRPSNNSASLLRGVSRCNSAPGRCRMTARSVPTSESQPSVTPSTLTMVELMELIHELTPSEMSQRSGVAVSALHFYEREGLIASKRTSGNQRRYARETLRRVAFIRMSQRLGIPLARIREALATLPTDRVPTSKDWARLSAGWRQDIDDRILHLQRLRDNLTGCIGCGCLSLKTCALSNPGDVLAERGPGAVRL